jgi:hypothetical protein
MATHTTPPEGSAFSRFMASCNGRLVRVGLGATIITAGLGAIGGTAGLAVAAAGLAPLATGMFNLCPIAPAWGGHFFGAKYCAVRKDD